MVKYKYKFFSSYASILHIFNRILRQGYFFIENENFLGGIRYICFRIHSL